MKTNQFEEILEELQVQTKLLQEIYKQMLNPWVGRNQYTQPDARYVDKPIVNQSENDCKVIDNQDPKEPKVVLLSIQKERLIKIISELPDRFPEIQSDDYDRGYRACKEEVIDLIK